MAEFLSYFRRDRLPHIWCPGCGNGTVTGALVRAIDKLGLDKNNTVIVSGIGCSSRSVGYLDFDTLHTTHGRAIAFATGVKLANPKLKVVVNNWGWRLRRNRRQSFYPCRSKKYRYTVIINQ